MALVLLSAIAEVVSLGAVLPFLTVLAAPEVAFGHPLAASVVRSLGIATPEGLVLPLTIAFAAAALVSAAIRLWLLRASTRFAFGTGSELSIEVYRRTLYQPYRVHVARSSSEVISGITHQGRRHDARRPAAEPDAHQLEHGDPGDHARAARHRSGRRARIAACASARATR